MSEEQKLNRAEVKLPTKTKIAVWWMLGYAIVATSITIWFLFHFPAWSDAAEWNGLASMVSFTLVCTGVLYCISSILIIIKRRGTWTLVMSIMKVNILISVLIALFLIFCYIMFGNYADRIILLVPIWIAGDIPFILVTQDRKNYFEMLRQRELEKTVK